MFDFFLDYHALFFFLVLTGFFIFIVNPIHNIFFFMLLCIQSFIFLAIFPKQHFFAFLLLIIYLGAIAVLFLFVVLVIGNSTFMLVNSKDLKQPNLFFFFRE